MTCEKCGANMSADMLFCPYCGTQNQSGVEHAQKIYDVDKDFMETHEEIIESGVDSAIKQLTIRLVAIFAIFLVVGFALYAGFNYRFGQGSKYWVTGSRLSENQKLVGQYLENGDYFRAYTLAAYTDPTQERFEYYPKYKDDLYAIFSFYLLFHSVDLQTENLDDHETPRALTSSDVLSYRLFYDLPDIAVKAELEKEADAYLQNFYQLTPEEVSELKTIEDYNDFRLDGSDDYETITRERMKQAFNE